MSSHDPSDFSRYRIRRRWWMGMYRYTRWRWHLVFAVVDALGWLLFGPARALRGLLRPFAARGGREHSVRRILLIQLDHLGDAILSVGMLHALRGEHPLARVDVLCSRWNRELFEMLPDVADIHVMKGSRFSRGGGWRWILEILRCGWRLRKKRYNLAIDVRGEFPHAVLMWLAGAQRRLGWRAGGGGFLLTDSPRWAAGRHELLSRLSLLRALGMECGVEDIAPRLPSGDETPLRRTRPAVVLHVAAGTQAKRWPAEHWRELAARLVAEFNAVLRLVGGRGELELTAELFHELDSLDVRNLVGQTSMVELVEVLRDSDLFIGADSGPAHLAAAVGTPAVVLFSGTNEPNQWRPVACQTLGEQVSVVRHVPACSPCHRETCPLGEHPCMTGLTPAKVMAAARRHLTAHFASYAVSEPSVSGGSGSGEPNQSNEPHETLPSVAEELHA